MVHKQRQAPGYLEQTELLKLQYKELKMWNDLHSFFHSQKLKQTKLEKESDQTELKVFVFSIHTYSQMPWQKEIYLLIMEL